GYRRAEAGPAAGPAEAGPAAPVPPTPAAQLKALCKRIGKAEPGQDPEQVLAEAHVRDPMDVIARLPLDRLDQASTQRLVDAALGAKDVRSLYRRLDVLRAATDKAMGIADGTRILLDVGWRPGATIKV